MAKETSTKLRNQIIYSVYVRNHTEEGTFRALQADLERIQALGTDIIWLMPIHPIGVKGKKGSLGCPYAIADYRAINPDYGTMEDFERLVERIHALGMKCIIDVVYNHTSQDSVLLKRHPEYFYHKRDGSFGNKCGEWGDVYDLDYNVKELWDEQIETLKYWAGYVDGFRCDVASCVPVDFWCEARKAVKSVNKDCIWLAESVHPAMIYDYRQKGLQIDTDAELYEAFDVEYQYDIVTYFDRYLAGEGTLKEYLDSVCNQEVIYPLNYNKLRYLENHDSDRICSKVKDRDALYSWTAFLYLMKGTTLLYAGQEVCNDNTPSLFEKDTVDWEKENISEYIARLGQIKKKYVQSDFSYKAYVAEGKKDIAVVEHIAGGLKVCGVFGFGTERGVVKVPLGDGCYKNLVDDSEIIVKEGSLELKEMPIIISAE